MRSDWPLSDILENRTCLFSRACVSGPNSAALFLLLALPQANVHAHDSILVPDRDNRYVPGDVIFGLNNLLRGLRNIGDVGECQVVGDLLLDGHPSTAGVVLGSTRLRVNFYSAYPK